MAMPRKSLPHQKPIITAHKRRLKKKSLYAMLFIFCSLNVIQGRPLSHHKSDSINFFKGQVAEKGRRAGDLLELYHGERKKRQRQLTMYVVYLSILLQCLPVPYQCIYKKKSIHFQWTRSFFFFQLLFVTSFCCLAFFSFFFSYQFQENEKESIAYCDFFHFVALKWLLL